MNYLPNVPIQELHRAINYFYKHNGIWICLKARGGIFELGVKLEKEFPDETVYYIGNPNPDRCFHPEFKQTSLAVRFEDEANEAVFYMKYIAN